MQWMHEHNMQLMHGSSSSQCSANNNIKTCMLDYSRSYSTLGLCSKCCSLCRSRQMGLKRKQVKDDSYCMKAPKRKPNWTETEQNRMLDLYANYKELLASKHKTPRHKADCWVNITVQLNEGNTLVKRSVDEVKRKWHNLVGQARRDFYDWKRTQQDANTSSWTMPAKSCRALELFFNSKFEDWKNKTDDLQWDDGSNQEDCEIQNSEANDADTCDHEQPPERLPCTPSHAGSLPASAIVKEELDTNVLPSSAFVAHMSKLSSSASRTAARIPSTSFQDTAIQPTPQVQNVWSAYPMASMNNNCENTVPASKDSGSGVKGRHDLETIAASASMHQISLESLHQAPVTMASVHPSSSCTIVPTSLHASSTLHSQASPSPPPEEPARKKLRESETAQSKREAELRMDILQLEKDKLWLETEKLRLEIDILRKQKQQMDNN